MLKLVNGRPQQRLTSKQANGEKTFLLILSLCYFKEHQLRLFLHYLLDLLLNYASGLPIKEAGDRKAQSQQMDVKPHASPVNNSHR